MKSEYPSAPTNSENKTELIAPTSRFIDEKISDDSGMEAKADSALKPAELNNPFWN